MSKKRIPLSMLILSVVCVALVVGGLFVYRTLRAGSPRGGLVWDFLRDPDAHQDWVIEPGARCGDAPFVFPTRGFVGFLWDDSFRIGHRHQGLDIFAGTEVGLTPVYAAYDGYLTRLGDWKSSVIMRVPSDPLAPGRQIWLYYTHMADSGGTSYIVEAFPPGTHEVFVTTGTLLGYQGNFSGDPDNPTGVHLHFSIVRDDGSGQFLNELDIDNTLDPSPYFGLPLNGKTNGGVVPVCGE